MLIKRYYKFNLNSIVFGLKIYNQNFLLFGLMFLKVGYYYEYINILCNVYVNKIFLFYYNSGLLDFDINYIFILYKIGFVIKNCVEQV